MPQSVLVLILPYESSYEARRFQDERPHQERIMSEQYDIKTMAEKITALRQNAEELKKLSHGMPSVDRNAERILAHVKMLEININDVVDILG